MAKPRDVAEEYLQEMVRRFDLVDGKLYNKETVSNRVKKGTEAGNTNNVTGYRVVIIKGRGFRVHRIIYYLHYGVWPGDFQVDHIDGDKLNNKPENLRLVTSKQNNRSYRKPYKNPTSKYRGVCWDKESNKYKAKIFHNNKNIHLGYFTCEKEAALAYNIAAYRYEFNPESFNKVF
jgi:hypothetical protein